MWLVILVASLQGPLVDAHAQVAVAPEADPVAQWLAAHPEYKAAKPASPEDIRTFRRMDAEMAGRMRLRAAGNPVPVRLFGKGKVVDYIDPGTGHRFIGWTHEGYTVERDTVTGKTWRSHTSTRRTTAQEQAAWDLARELWPRETAFTWYEGIMVPSRMFPRYMGGGRWR